MVQSQNHAHDLLDPERSRRWKQLQCRKLGHPKPRFFILLVNLLLLEPLAADRLSVAITGCLRSRTGLHARG